MRSSTRVLWGYRAGAWASRLVPVWALDPVSAVIGRTVAALMPARRQVVARNLARALEGDDPAALRRASAVAFCSYIHYWIESFQLPHLGPERVVRQVTPEGLPHLKAAVAAGRGTILALPHLGSWDYAGAWMSASGYPMTVVMEPLEPPQLFEMLAGIRRSLGMRVVRLGPEAVGEVMASLRRNQVVGLLADRDLTGSGVEVEFFGETTTLPAGPAALALRTGATLLPTATYTLPRGGHAPVVTEPIPVERTGRFRQDVVRVTQLLARALEGLIRRAPEQWHMFQPNWPADGAGRGRGRRRG